MSRNHFELVIIGDGIAGFSVGHAAVLRQKKVCIISKSKVRGDATSHSAGIFDPFPHASFPKELLPLTMESLKFYPTFIKKLCRDGGDKVGYRRRDILYAAMTSQESKNLRKMEKVLSPFGGRLLSSKEVRKMEPLISESVLEGVILPKMGQLSPLALLRAMKKSFLKSRGMMLSSPSGASYRSLSGGGWRVQCGKRVVFADKLVLATGAWQQKLSPSLPIFPSRGQIAVYRAQGELKTLLHYSEGSYAIPWEGSKYWLVGATVENKGFRAYTTSDGLDFVHQNAVKLIPALQSKLPVKVWAGLRPLSQDRKPLIGKLEKDLFIVNGLFRSGILIAPYIGELIQDMIFNDKQISVFKPFHPLRFG